MSVVKGKRGENKLGVLDLARKQVITTMRYCKQEKVFPKRERWILAAPICILSVAAYVCIKIANKRYIRDEEDVRFRIRCEQLAHSLFAAQLGLMDIAYELNRFPDDKIATWTKAVDTTDIALEKWIKSEYARLG